MTCCEVSVRKGLIPVALGHIMTRTSTQKNTIAEEETIKKNQTAARLRNIAKILVTSPIVINMPTRELLAGETKNSFV